MANCRVPGPTCAESVEPRGSNPPRGGFASPSPVGANTAGAVSSGITGWPRDIRWSEFSQVSRSPGGITEDAQIHSEVDSVERVNLIRENGQFRVSGYTARIKVVREDTWVVLGKKTDALLAHEQGHFDITGLC